jgi:hypothetical protein
MLKEQGGAARRLFGHPVGYGGHFQMGVNLHGNALQFARRFEVFQKGLKVA